MRIDFYVNTTDPIKTACQITKKAVASNLRVWVYSDDTQRLDRFDKALWTFESLAFIPHCDQHSPLASQTSVWLLREAPTNDKTQPDILINLSEKTHSWFSLTPRIIEVVGQLEEEKNAGRGKFRQYKEQGITPNTIDLSQNTAK